ncbi:MAG TPA: phosphatase PAP2 family protein [Tepidisphaeraceae bacterium]|nr:phosphatase PAP2 family protein [Tepidisphaeraceae bacterium]
MAAKPRGPKKSIIVVASLAVMFCIALVLDVPVSTWAHDSGLAGWLKGHWLLTHIIRIPGHFIFFTLPVCVVILIREWAKNDRDGPPVWKKPAIVLLAGILSGINALLKWMIGRIRPYHGVPPFELHPFKTGLLNVEASYSFPSGDVALAVAMSASLTMVFPRLWPLWWTLAVIVALERIAENAHYPSDTVAGAALGIAVAVLARKMIRFLGKKDENSSGGFSVVTQQTSSGPIS